MFCLIHAHRPCNHVYILSVDPGTCPIGGVYKFLLSRWSLITSSTFLKVSRFLTPVRWDSAIHRCHDCRLVRIACAGPPIPSNELPQYVGGCFYLFSGCKVAIPSYSVSSVCTLALAETMPPIVNKLSKLVSCGTSVAFSDIAPGSTSSIIQRSPGWSFIHLHQWLRANPSRSFLKSVALHVLTGAQRLLLSWSPMFLIEVQGLNSQMILF